MHLGQYHFPFGFVVRFMQPKWNHSMGQSALSHPIISPYDTCADKEIFGLVNLFGSNFLAKRA